MRPATPPNAQMPTTQWSLIARLRGDDTGQARAALDELCRAYHYPLYCQIRRRGLSHHDAEDALHEFLSKLLRKESFGVADAEKGRLRTYLLVALMRFLNSWQRDQQRQDAREISAEALAAIAGVEGRFDLDESAHHESPDRLYDRQWAQELMNQVMQRLSARYEAKRKGALFAALRPVLITGGSLTDHDGIQLAEQLGIRPGALRTSLSRLLDDYREALRHEVMLTMEDRAEAKVEYAELKAAFMVG